MVFVTFIPPHCYMLSYLKVNDHSASSWKDYYLEHGDHIDLLVIEHGLQFSKSPSSRDVPTRSSQNQENCTNFNVPESPLGTPSTLQPVRPQSPLVDDKSFPASPIAGHHHRTRTSNVHHKGHRAKACYEVLDMQIPPPPSRSPSPPVVDADELPSRSYTDAEKAFFVTSIQWQLKNDPLKSKNALSWELSEKVSWV